MIEEKEIYKFIKALIQRINYLETNNPKNPNLDKLKLLLSDNVSEEAEIHIRPSLQNKEAHLYFSNVADSMDRFKEEDLYN